MKTAYNLTGDFFFTTTLSNLGVLTLPKPLCNHVVEVSVALGPSLTNPYNLAMATVGNTAVLTVTRTTNDSVFEAELLQAASEFGVMPQ